MEKTTLLLVLIFLLSSQKGLCSFMKERKIKEWRVFITTGRARLKEKSDYKIIPVRVKIGLGLISFLPKSWNFKNLFEVVFEPFFSRAISLVANVECGVVF